MMKFDARYWQSRYQDGNTPWDIGYPAPALIRYFELLVDKKISILIPGAGYGHEAAWLFAHGFTNTWICEWAPSAIDSFQERYTHFPAEQILCQDFFSLTDPFDLIVEQTFLSALEPANRDAYARQCRALLVPEGILAGLLFSHPFDLPGPPFGADQEEYEALFSRYFSRVTLRNCENSIGPRAGRELFLEAHP